MKKVRQLQAFARTAIAPPPSSSCQCRISCSCPPARLVLWWYMMVVRPTDCFRFTQGHLLAEAKARASLRIIIDQPVIRVGENEAASGEALQDACEPSTTRSGPARRRFGVGGQQVAGVNRFEQV
ncbi:MAG: hypothetical protein ACR2FJ_08070 [Qipengyuania sp.]